MTFVLTLKHIYQNYYKDTYVFKSCGDFIVILEKLPDTQTNEKRDGIVNAMFAEYIANKLLVIKILFKVNHKDEIKEVCNTIYPYKTIKYKRGEIVEAQGGVYYYKHPSVPLFDEPQLIFDDDKLTHLMCICKDTKNGLLDFNINCYTTDGRVYGVKKFVKGVMEDYKEIKEIQKIKKNIQNEDDSNENDENELQELIPQKIKENKSKSD